jgi:membrane-associated phospholipid phosphatase
VKTMLNNTKNKLHWERLSGDGLIEMGVASALVFVFASLAEDVWFKEPFAWDAPIMLAIHRLASPFLNKLMLLVTQMGEIGAAVAVILLAIIFIIKRQRTNLISLIVIFVGAVVLNTLIKSFFSRPRPDVFPPLVNEQSYSFPSGHVAASVAVYGFLAVLLWQNHHRIWAILVGLWIPIVAFSRVYLGVHYPSDVLGAFAFTSLWLLMIFVIRDRHLLKLKAPVPEIKKKPE